MKKSIFIIAGFSLLALTYSACNSKDKTSNSTEQTTGEAIYSCPMHPEVTSDKPGQCSKCGMDLVKK